MIKTKEKISRLTISVVLMVFLALVLITNLLISKYIEDQAVRSIESIRGLYEDFQQEEETNDIYLMVDSIDISRNYEENIISNIYLSSSQKDIMEYIKKNKVEKDSIKEISIGDKSYYILLFTNPYEEVPNIADMVLFTDVTPFKNLIATMNMIYGVLFVVLIGGSYFIGLNVGKRIEDSQEKLKAFFQNASHELKTPLMSIQGYAEGLQVGVIKDEDKALNIIIDESDKMSKLVDELLYISKLDSGQISLKKEKINLSNIINDLLSSFAPIIKNKNIDILLEVENNVEIIGDENEFSKALGNVLSNAIRYAKSQIQIKVAKIGNKTQIKIFNDGQNISPEELPHIFERFFTGNKGNTGIGLSMAQDIIKRHKGEINVENKTEGVEFIIEIQK
ncbi:MAG: HAMP domain-containing histidine kinase [Tissierellia bacterium]|nr:HAMP domain-containing histidine kinase [Tissierellia bacterium]